MSSISLEASIRTCKVDTGWANKIQSDRFQNPALMVCPIWNGVDTAGRTVAADSFYTTRAGCNSAEDRVLVENNVSRPQYAEYINLNANGIEGNIYGNTTGFNQSGSRTRALANAHTMTGQFGQVSGLGQYVYPRCQNNGQTGYQQGMAEVAQQMRQAQALEQGYGSNNNRMMGGM